MQKKKTICFAIPKNATFSTGGAELQVYYISEQLLKQGWKVEFLSMKPRGEMDPAFVNPQIRYHYYKPTRIRALGCLTILWRLLFIDAHVFYQRTDFILTGTIAFYCRLTGKKMVYALAHDDDAMPLKYSTEYKNNGRVKGLKGWIYLMDILALDRVVEYGKRNAHLVVVQSETQKERMQANFNRSSVLIRNSIPVLASPETLPKEKVILWVANMRKFKQPEVFLQLASELQEKDWQFVMIGEPDEAYSHMIRSFSGDNLTYLGPLDYQRTGQWFERASIYINTSYSEGFPNTFLQAWKAGTYVMSLSVDPDQLLSTYNLGYWAGHEFEDLKRQLKMCMEQGIDQEAIHSAHAFVRREFDLVRNVERLEKQLVELT